MALKYFKNIYHAKSDQKNTIQKNDHCLSKKNNKDFVITVNLIFKSRQKITKLLTFSNSI